MKKFMLAVIIVGMIAPVALAASQRMENGDFETGAGDGWTMWNGIGVFGAPIEVRAGHGTSIAIWGPFSPSPWGNSGANQAFAASEGQLYTLSGEIMHSYYGGETGTDNEITGDAYGVILLVFKDSGGIELASHEVIRVDAATTEDIWRSGSKTFSAPADTATVEALLLFQQPVGDETGAAWFDNISLVGSDPGEALLINPQFGKGVPAGGLTLIWDTEPNIPGNPITCEVWIDNDPNVDEGTGIKLTPDNMLRNADFLYGAEETYWFGWKGYAIVDQTPGGTPLPGTGKSSPGGYGDYAAVVWGEGGTDPSGMVQELPATAGTAYTLSGELMHMASNSPLQDIACCGAVSGPDPNDPFGVLKIAFMDANGDEIEGHDILRINNGTTTDVWQFGTGTHVAPAGTASVQALIMVVQPLMWGNAVAYFDNLSLTGGPITSIDIYVVEDMDYFWRVDCTETYAGGDVVTEGTLWEFNTRDLTPNITDISADQYVTLNGGTAIFVVSGTMLEDAESEARTWWTQGNHETDPATVITTIGPGPVDPNVWVADLVEHTETINLQVTADNTGWYEFTLHAEDATGVTTATTHVGVYVDECARTKADPTELYNTEPNGDTNGDCRIDLEDFANLAISWLSCPGSGLTAAMGYPACP